MPSAGASIRNWNLQSAEENNVAQVYIPEKKGAIDKILQGLQVAQSVYGVKSAYDQNKLNQMKMQEVENAKRTSEGKFTTGERNQLFQIGADSQYYKDAVEAEDISTGEKFRYLPEEKLKKIKVMQDITESDQKNILENEYRAGRLRPRERDTAVDTQIGGQKPQGTGWIQKWDITPQGKRVDIWLLPSASANYQLSLERQSEAQTKTETENKKDLQKSYTEIGPVITSLKILDSHIKSDDEQAPIPGSDEVIAAMKNKTIAQLFSNNEIWEKPDAVTSQLRSPEAKKFWLDFSNFVQRVRRAEAGQAVSAGEAAGVLNKVGLHAFTNTTTLKNAVNNAKAEFYSIIQSRESPFYDGQKPKKILQDIWRAPGSISSQDPFFKKFKNKTNIFEPEDKNDSAMDNYIKKKGGG